MIEVIKNQISKLVKRDVAIDVSASEKGKFGHYSTSIAFKLAPVLKKKPLEIANDLAGQLSGNLMFEKVEAVAPGFVNFWLSSKFLQKETQSVLKSGVKFKKQKPQKINVEFVSANPTGPLTMANGRGGFYGDVLCNILGQTGHKVTREFYVNDTGNQIKLLGESISAFEGKIPVKEEYYKGDYLKEFAGKSGQQAVALLLAEIKNSLKKAGIKYDVWFSEEGNLHKKGEVKKILEFLKKKGLVEEKDGALWLEDIVLIKSDGNPTYFLVDLAYHFNKLVKRKFDLAVNIWGTDHHGAAARLKKGVELIGIKPEKLKFILMQLVRLVSAGKEVKMSKRAGEFVTMDELLKEVGTDVARFFFLMHAPETHMDFDLDLAKEQSQKNPVYYVQYAYVRALNILKKSRIKNQELKNVNLLKSESEIKLMLEMVKLPDVVAECAKDYQVHRLTKYAMELAKAFHNFYEKERVLNAEKNLAEARLALVSAAKIVFENLFGVLGIGKPEKM